MSNFTAFDAETTDHDIPVPYMLTAAGWQVDETTAQSVPYSLTALAWNAA